MVRKRGTWLTSRFPRFALLAAAASLSAQESRLCTEAGLEASLAANPGSERLRALAARRYLGSQGDSDRFTSQILWFIANRPESGFLACEAGGSACEPWIAEADRARIRVAWASALASHPVPRVKANFRVATDCGPQEEPKIGAPPRFEQFAVHEPLPDRSLPAQVEWACDRAFWALSAGPGPADFAGHFRVVQWTCGSDCIVSGVVDVLTGDVYLGISLAFGHYVSSGVLPLQYRRDSRLLVATQCDTARFDTTTCGIRSYEWTGTRFRPLTIAPYIGIR